MESLTTIYYILKIVLFKEIHKNFEEVQPASYNRPVVQLLGYLQDISLSHEASCQYPFGDIVT